MGNLSNKEYTSAALKTAYIGMAGNLLLAAIKFITGMLFHSTAVISDAVHSLCDLFGDLIIIAGIKLSDNEIHEKKRFEKISSAVISSILIVTGLVIGIKALKQIFIKQYNCALTGGTAVITAEIISVLIKEALFRYTRYRAEKLNSLTLRANAWHHRSDALSSLCALAGITGAKAGFACLESAAGVLICVLILKTAFGILIQSIRSS
ncbi:MAG: cation diffusion facilitator family transporter [Clostridia bacterium]|nr:cation diffusion facilitator family transporter [Clostridia bacterium]